MDKIRVQRRATINELDDNSLDRIVDEAIERFRPLETRDADFERRFGKWYRPDQSLKYPIEQWVNRIVWHACGNGIIDADRFVKSFPDRADRTIVGEICRFVTEEYEGKFATDTTLRSFRANLLRRLDLVGY